jgi:predicted CXXCH cytochrome family protein
MNKILVAVLSAFALAGAAVDAEPPATITFDAKQGKVTFSHKAHAEKLAKKCQACHADAKGGKIPNFSKDAAHALCKKCHEETVKATPTVKAPTKCNECHKKA